jgi:hypothetical protein
MEEKKKVYGNFWDLDYISNERIEVKMKEKSVPRFSSYAAKPIIYMHGTDTAVLEIAPLLF